MDVDMEDEKGQENGMQVLEEEEKDPSENVERLPSEKEDDGESLIKQSVNGESLDALSEDKKHAINPSNDDNANERQGDIKNDADDLDPSKRLEDAAACEESPDTEAEENEIEEEPKDGDGAGKNVRLYEDTLEKQVPRPELDVGHEVETKDISLSCSWETQYADGNESGTEEEQYEFRREVETFYKERCLEFKAPKFYKEEVNLLKLYRAVIKLGGYEQVTSCKLWRQVGAPFKPPKTCTTVSWTFRNFYEKSLLEYEKHRMRCGELPFTEDSSAIPKVESQVGVNQSSGSGRAIRDAAARAMHVWNSPHVADGDDVKPSFSSKSDKHPKSIGVIKRKKPSNLEHAVVQGSRMKPAKPQMNAVIVDVGPPAEWVKINVYKISDCFEVYALVPGLLREEVHIQSDPAGRLIITGQPQQLDNPWGVTPFKKVISLPCRIDPHQTSAVVTLNGQLFIRVPFEQTDM